MILQNSRNSIGRMVTKVGNALSLSGREDRAEDSRNTFTPGLDYKLDDEEESKSPAEAIESFHEVDDLLPDTLNPAVAAMRALPEKDDSPKVNKKYCQLCFREFTMLTKKKHCYYCKRSCCQKCSYK